MAYTHFYELYKRVPRARRKSIAKFIHEVKKLSGRKYHCYVLEMLEDCDEDYLSIDVTKLDMETEEQFENELMELVDEYGILIRSAHNFAGLNRHYIRVAAQSPEENKLLVNALRQLCEQ